MLRIREAIVVEGRYDKHALAGTVDAVIIPTDGFGIFRQRETLELIRRLAQRQGVILLTDPDGAGPVTRHFLKPSPRPGRGSPASIKKSACGPREGPPALFSFLSPQFSQALGTRRSRHSRYFSWVLATTSSGRSGAGVTPASLLSVSQSRRYCLS